MSLTCQKRNEFAVGRAEHTTSLDHIATLLSETYEISMETAQEQLGDLHIDVEQTSTLVCFAVHSTKL